MDTAVSTGFEKDNGEYDDVAYIGFVEACITGKPTHEEVVTPIKARNTYNHITTIEFKKTRILNTKSLVKAKILFNIMNMCASKQCRNSVVLSANDFCFLNIQLFTIVHKRYMSINNVSGVTFPVRVIASVLYVLWVLEIIPIPNVGFISCFNNIH